MTFLLSLWGLLTSGFTPLPDGLDDLPYSHPLSNHHG